MSNPTTSAGFSSSTPAPDSGYQNAKPRDTGTTPLDIFSFEVPNTGGTSVKTANYTAVAGDCGTLIVFNSGSAVTLTLPAAPPFAQWQIAVQNIGAGTLTINRNGLNIDGAASNLTLAQNSGAQIFTDGTNYFTERGVFALPNSGVTAGSYTNASVTVNAQGIVTAASNGSAGAGAGLIQLIQYATSTGTTCTFSHNVQAGSTVIVEWVGNSTTPSFTDNQGNTYTVYNAITWSTVTTTPAQAAALNVAAGALTVTASTTGVINIYEYSNVDSIEDHNGAKNDGVTGSTLATGNVTATIPQDVIHMTGMGNASSGVTLGNTGSWPSIQTVATSGVTIESWNTTGSVTGTFSNTMTFSGIAGGGFGHAYTAILALKPRAVHVLTLTTTGSGAATLSHDVLNIPSPGFTLTTSGSSGPASITGTVLNIPNYGGGGGGGSSYPLTFVQESQFQSGSGNVGSYTITFPATTASSGNTAFILLACDGSTTVTAPGGWTVDLNVQQATYSRFILAHKATASDTSATFTVGSPSSFQGWFFEVAGTHALDQSSTGGIANNSVITPPAITPTANSVVFSVAVLVPSAATWFSTGILYNASPQWKTFFCGGQQTNARTLIGNVSTIAATHVSTQPPVLTHAISLFGGGGIAYATFSIL